MEENEVHSPIRETTRYVDGFLLSQDKRKVVLIRKNKPAWMHGRLNAVGGRIERNETDVQAMEREFKEEAGVHISNWNHYLTLRGRGFEVECFWADASYQVLAQCHSAGEEHVAIYDLDCLHLHGQKMTNLDWMIAMALSMPKEMCQGFIVEEQYGKRLHDHGQRLRQADKWLS